MPNWMIKAAAQRAIGFLPARHVWNNALQERVAGTVTLDDHRFEDKLRRARGHMAAYAAHARRYGPPGRAVEIGTGWFPVVPLAFWVCGTRSVATYDLERHLTPARLSATVKQFAAAWRDGRLDRALPDLDPARARRLDVLAEAEPEGLFAELERLGLRYRVGDAVRAGIPPGSIDLLFTTAVLEYVPYSGLVAMLRGSGDLLAEDGCMSHWIDMADEYAYFDRRITPFNFLRFSERTWRLINNPIIPLSRLRIGDYRRAFAEAGLAIVGEESRRGAEGDLARVPLARQFRNLPREDLAVLDAWMIAVPARYASSGNDRSLKLSAAE